MNNICLKRTLMCCLVLFISIPLFSQTFGSVRKKTQDHPDLNVIVLNPCYQFSSVFDPYQFELYLTEDNFIEPCENMVIKISINGAQIFQDLSSDDLADDPFDPSIISVPIPEVVEPECEEGQKTIAYEVSISLMCDSGDGVYQHVYASDLQGVDADPGIVGMTETIRICCPGHSPTVIIREPGEDLDGGREAGKIKTAQASSDKFTHFGNVNIDKEVKANKSSHGEIQVLQNSYELIIRNIGSTTNDYSLNVFSLAGNRVNMIIQKNIDQVTFDISHLPQGYYIISGTIDNERFSKPFIKI